MRKPKLREDIPISLKLTKDLRQRLDKSWPKTAETRTSFIERAIVRELDRVDRMDAAR